MAGTPRQAPLILPRYSSDRTDRTVLLDEFAGDIVERLERFGVDADVPIAVGHDVVAGAGLRLGGRGQLVLLALRGDVVDLHLDAVLRAPFVAKRRQRVVGIRAPNGPRRRALNVPAA